jgi:hypothetical protein
VTIINSIIGRAARSARPAAAATALVALVAAAGCSSTARSGQGASYLIIDALQIGTDTGNEVRYNSDVQTEGSVYEDMALVTFSVAMRDVTNPNGPTENNAITVNRYRVTFRRSDGRATPGVDVPYAFDGAFSATIRPGDQVQWPFVIVRAQAKLESPLMQLRGLGGAVSISTIAEVTFYGRDQAGREAQVTGLVSVNFADWADPEN